MSDFSTSPHALEVTCHNVEELVRQVFSAPPPEPHQYQLTMDGATTQHDIFRALGQILTHGLVYLYGEEVDLLTLSATQIHHIQTYLRGFGFQALINPKDLSEHPRALPWILKLPIPPSTLLLPTEPYIHIVFETFLN